MVPCTLALSQQYMLQELAQRVVHLYGDTITGVIHFEAKIDGIHAVPLELNLRLGGAETYRMVLAAYGVSSGSVHFDCHSLLCLCLYRSVSIGCIGSPQVDLIRLALRMQLGETLSAASLPALDQPQAYTSSINIVPHWHAPRAILVALDIDPALALDPSHIAHVFFYAPGSLLRLPPEAAQYLGWIAASGATRAEADANLQRLASMVTWRLEDVPCLTTPPPAQPAVAISDPVCPDVTAGTA